MMFGVPIMQLLLFGYAINTDPHNLPTAVIAADDSQITRTVLSALSSTGYMRFNHLARRRRRRPTRSCSRARCSSSSPSRRTSRAA